MIRSAKWAAITISTLLIVFLVRPVVSQLCLARAPLNAYRISMASVITAENAKYDYALGLLYYAIHDSQSLKMAIRKLHSSLQKNTTDGRVWFALAKAYNDADLKGPAEYAFKKAALVWRGDRDIQWEAGVFLLLEGKTSDAVLAFRQYIRLNPIDQEAVFSLFYTLGFEPSFILDSLVEKDYRSYKAYLNFLVTNGRVADSVEAWKKLASWGRSRADYIEYANFLIDTGSLEKARDLWSEYTKTFSLIDAGYPYANLVWNGGFELPVQDGGFDWRIGKADGVKVFIDSEMKKIGHAALSAQFSGRTNPEIYLARQAVPVEPGAHYALRGRILTDNLTTTNGIILEAMGHACEGLVQKTEPVTGSTIWKDVETEFTVPEQCKAIWVGIKREKSEKFDNRISGDVWVDLISLTPAKKSSTAAR